MRPRRVVVAVGVGVAALLSGFVPARAASREAQSSARQLALHHPLVSVAASQSTNWSGYNVGALERSATFHGVSGTWVVPKASSHKQGEAEYSSSWIGVGGGCLTTDCSVTDNTLIQIGTEQDAGPTGGPHYYAWWELIPAPSVMIADANGNPLPVQPGDRIHAEVAETAPQLWTMTLQNESRHWTFTQTVPYSSTYGSAEWIEETPVVIDTSGSSGFAALPNLTTEYFGAARIQTATGSTFDNPALVAAEAIQLVDSNGKPLATPSAPTSAGDAFNICAYSSSCATPTTAK